MKVFFNNLRNLNNLSKYELNQRSCYMYVKYFKFIYGYKKVFDKYIFFNVFYS